jgi:hypothetical protein
MFACAWTAAVTFLLSWVIGSPARGEPGARARDLHGALAGALSVACSGAVLRAGQVVMADGLAMAFAATAMLCAAWYGRTRRGLWLGGCAVALALGAVTRWMVGLLALPIFGYFLIERRRSPPGVRMDGNSPAGAGGQAAWPFLVAAVAGLAILVPQLLAAHDVPKALEKHEWLERWSFANIFGRHFNTRDGEFRYHLPVGLFYAVRLGWPDYFSPLAGGVAALGASVIVIRRRAAEATLLVGWVVVAWLFVSGIPFENPRFLLPTLPAVGALAGFGFESLRDRARRSRRWIVSALLASSVAAGLFFGGREHARTVDHKNTDRALASWTARRVPAGVTLLRSGGTLMLEYYELTSVRDIYSLSSAGLDDLLDRGGTFYYLENVAEIDTSWRGLIPYRHLDALRRRGLLVIDRQGPFTLFRVSSARRFERDVDVRESAGLSPESVKH